MMFFMIVCMVFKVVLVVATLFFGRSVSGSIVEFLNMIDKVLTYAWMIGTFMYIVKHEKALNERNH